MILIWFFLPLWWKIPSIFGFSFFLVGISPCSLSSRSLRTVFDSSAMRLRQVAKKAVRLRPNYLDTYIRNIHCLSIRCSKQLLQWWCMSMMLRSEWYWSDFFLPLWCKIPSIFRFSFFPRKEKKNLIPFLPLKLLHKEATWPWKHIVGTTSRSVTEYAFYHIYMYFLSYG